MAQNSHAVRNIVTLDQEGKGLVAVVNGGAPVVFDPTAGAAGLPSGGGYVVADANVWAVRNERSQAQFCWATDAELAWFVESVRAAGYQERVVSNTLAKSAIIRYGYSQAEAVCALWQLVHDQVCAAGVRDEGAVAGVFGCGRKCVHGRYDGGHRVRLGRSEPVDRSFGERDRVVDSFLMVQNTPGAYESGFVAAAAQIAFDALDRHDRPLLNLNKTKVGTQSRNRVVALAVCTHDPLTGERRMFEGRPWGSGFIFGRVIGLNGVMCGTGLRTAGNPMRAVLRGLGRRRTADAVDREARAAIDRAARLVVRALQEHATLPPILD